MLHAFVHIELISASWFLGCFGVISKAVINGFYGVLGGFQGVAR